MQEKTSNEHKHCTMQPFYTAGQCSRKRGQPLKKT